MQPSRDSALAPETAILVRLQPEWEHIEPLRSYVELYATQQLGRQLAERIALVVHELLENAVKYGSLGRSVELDVRVAPVGGGFEVRVSNQAVTSRLHLLSRELERLQRMDPQQAYVDAIKRSKQRSVGSCGIGLARIRSEARVALDMEVEDSWLTVRATSE